jgi:enoyl-CoA hydratase/carnithine racemase
MIAGVERAARAAEADPEVFAICITGSGRGFSAGIDMGLLQASASGEGRTVPSGPAEALFGFLLKIDKPVIAAINGVTAGGGFVLAMMCDLRFMADDAMLTTVFSRRGLIAEHGMSWLLPRVIGLSRALDVLWSSRKIDAAEAVRLGLADRVAPADKLLAKVEAYVAEMAETVAPRALATIKRQLHDHLQVSFEVAVHESADLMREALAHPDATEGARSYVERRPPRFAPLKG